MKLLRASLILLCKNETTEEDIQNRLVEVFDALGDEDRKLIFGNGICLLEVRVDNLLDELNKRI